MANHLLSCLLYPALAVKTPMLDLHFLCCFFFFLPPVLISLWTCPINLDTLVSGSSCVAPCAIGAYEDGFPVSFRLLHRWCVLPESLWYNLGPAEPFLLLNPKSWGHHFVCSTTAFIRKEDWNPGELQPPGHVTVFGHHLSLLVLSSAHLLQ